MRKALVGLLVLAIGCGDSTGPESRTLQTGRYAYEAFGGELRGTLTLTYATADSVAGTWDVRDARGVRAYQTPVLMGAFNLDAYVVYARGETATSVIYTHRIARAGDSYTCSGNIPFVRPVPCVVRYLGP